MDTDHLMVIGSIDIYNLRPINDQVVVVNTEGRLLILGNSTPREYEFESYKV